MRQILEYVAVTRMRECESNLSRAELQPVIKHAKSRKFNQITPHLFPYILRAVAASLNPFLGF